MKIEVLGTGCRNCEIVAERAAAVAQRLGIEFELLKVTDRSRIADYGVLMTPALVINGELTSSAKVLSEAEITTLIKAAMEPQKIGFIGGGRVARILLGGLAHAATIPARVVVYDPNEAALKALRAPHPSVKLASAPEIAAAQDIVFLAVHPPVLGDILSRIGDKISDDTVLVSLAPKFTVAEIEQCLGTARRVVRMIPNAASIIGQGYNPLFFNSSFADRDKKDLLHLFSAWGDCPEVAEDDLEAYAVLTAMGPTYFWPQLYELRSLGVSFGLNPAAAAEGIEKMIRGTLATMEHSALTPEEVQDLIPVQPMAQEQAAIVQAYRQKLRDLWAKLRP